MPDETHPLSVMAVLLCQGDALALALAPPSHWQPRDGYTFISAELPGGPVAVDADPDAIAGSICRATLGCGVALRPSARLFGPSREHAIDELPPEGEAGPLPVLRVARMLPLEQGERSPVMVTVRVYLADSHGPIRCGDITPPILWLTPRALRNALRGVPLGELLAQSGACLDVAADAALPGDAFIFIPGDYGERLLVRVAAKYGPDALFQPRNRGGPDGARQ